MFLAFGGSFYYPGGGVEDYIGTYATVAEADAAILAAGVEWWHIALLRVNGTLRKIFEGRVDYSFDGDPPILVRLRWWTSEMVDQLDEDVADALTRDIGEILAMPLSDL